MINRFHSKYKVLLLIITLIITMSSCESYDELPPLHDSYKKKLILPKGVFLTDSDREYLEELDAEYENSIK